MSRATGPYLFSFLLLASMPCVLLSAQSQEPTDAKAKKTYAEAMAASKGHDKQHALDLFRKADKQEGGQCWECAKQAALLALKLEDLKQARNEAIELEGLAKTPEEQSAAHFLHGVAALRAGANSHKDRDLTEADSELQKAITLVAGNPSDAIYADAMFQAGMSLANLNQDDAALTRFHEFLIMSPAGA